MTTAAKLIETVDFAAHLRARAIDPPNRRILISKLTGTDQELDLTLPANCGGFGRVRHFRIRTSTGWPPNPLPIVPACAALAILPPDEMTALVFQNSACAWRCWYCFVPEELLSANPNHSAWLSADELVDLYSKVPDTPRIIDLSGGSPDLVPEWTPWMMQALKSKGLDKSTYLWTDDNLSTHYLFDCLSREELALVREYRNYGRVCCIKGFDAESFSFNTRAKPDGFEQQFAILKREMDLGLDLYGYVTLTALNDQSVERGVPNLLDKIQELDPHFPLRIVPLEIQIFTPVQKRLARDEGREPSLTIQKQAIEVWNAEIQKRFPQNLRDLPINQVPLKMRAVI